MTKQQNMGEQKLHHLNFPYIGHLGTPNCLNLFSTSLCNNHRNNFSINQHLLKIIYSVELKMLFLLQY